MDRQDIINLLLRASNCPHGLLLEVSDPERAKAALYRAKQGEAIPPLEFKTVEHPEGNLLIRPPTVTVPDPVESLDDPE